MSVRYHFRKAHLEAGFWLTALLLLALSNPQGEPHYSLCLFKAAGFNHCAGCGLGHGIAWLLRGEWTLSWQSHPFSLATIGILFYRIFVLIKPDITFTKTIVKHKP